MWRNLSHTWAIARSNQPPGTAFVPKDIKGRYVSLSEVKDWVVSPLLEDGVLQRFCFRSLTSIIILSFSGLPLRHYLNIFLRKNRESLPPDLGTKCDNLYDMLHTGRKSENPIVNDGGKLQGNPPSKRPKSVAALLNYPITLSPV